MGRMHCRHASDLDLIAGVANAIVVPGKPAGMIELLLGRLDIPPQGNYAQAFDGFARCARAATIEGRKERAEAAMRLGDYATALADARACCQRFPEDATVNQLLGRAALAVAAARRLRLPIIGAGARWTHEHPDELLAESQRAFQRAAAASSDPRVHVGMQAAKVLALMGRNRAPALHHA